MSSLLNSKSRLTCIHDDDGNIAIFIIDTQGVWTEAAVHRVDK